MAKKWRSLVVGSVAISHFVFFLPQCAFTNAMRVQREPPSVVLVLVLVRVLVRSRSFSFAFSLVLVRSLSLRLLRRCFRAHSQSPESAALVFRACWLLFSLAGCEAKFRNFPSQYPRLPCTLQRLGFSTIQQLN